VDPGLLRPEPDGTLKLALRNQRDEIEYLDRVRASSRWTMRRDPGLHRRRDRSRELADLARAAAVHHARASARSSPPRYDRVVPLKGSAYPA